MPNCALGETIRRNTASKRGLMRLRCGCTRCVAAGRPDSERRCGRAGAGVGPRGSECCPTPGLSAFARLGHCCCTAGAMRRVSRAMRQHRVLATFCALRPMPCDADWFTNCVEMVGRSRAFVLTKLPVSPILKKCCGFDVTHRENGKLHESARRKATGAPRFLEDTGCQPAAERWKEEHA